MGVSQAVLTVLMAAFLCIILTPAVVAFLTRVRVRQTQRHDDCPDLAKLQSAKDGTPTMGGLLVMAVGCGTAVCQGGLSHPAGWAVMISGIAMAAVGFWDDFLKLSADRGVGLRSLPKLLLTLAVGITFGCLTLNAANAVQFMAAFSFAPPLVAQAAWVAFAALVMVACVHAVNLTDGMDGLATGCLAIAFVLYGIWAFVGLESQVIGAPWALAFAGSCMGFLMFNRKPASVFLGDVGALGLGAVLAAVSLLSAQTLWLVWVGGVFVAEAVSVILQVGSYKLRGGKRIFRVAPIHHHFQLGGMSESQIVKRFWMIGLGLALTAWAVRGTLGG